MFRMTRARSSLLLFVTLSVLAACDGGGGDETITRVGRDLIHDLAEVVCRRSIECGGGDIADVDDCADATVNLVCSMDEACDRTYMLSGNDWDACLDAYAGYSCPALDTSMPDECLFLEDLFDEPAMILAH
jgi:hypothetical protein